MDHMLINTLIASIVTAFIFGMVARRLKLPVILGYMLAGVAIGPRTPGFVGDVEIARQFAEIGIILLMFGVGLHFSFRELMRVRKLALPGAVVQMLFATAIGTLVAMMLGYPAGQGVVFGLSLSVASTIVLLRALEQRHLLGSEGGRLAIGWLIVEDILMVLALMLLPVVAEMQRSETLEIGTIVSTLLVTMFKIMGLFAFMLVVGRLFLPRLLTMIARMRSHELSVLGTLTIALGFASIANVVFDASLALGAFLAGMMLGESEIGRKSARNSLPMRDAFSVLFFVSVGMLFDPVVLVEQPLAVLMTFLVIVVAKGAAALFITRLFQQTKRVSYTIAVGLAQIGEFSFILGGMALTHGMLTQDLYNLILAGAILSIVANPFLFRLFDRFMGKR